MYCKRRAMLKTRMFPSGDFFSVLQSGTGVIKSGTGVSYWYTFRFCSGMIGGIDSEAERCRGMKRREVRQALKEMPIESILMVGKSQLTAKQKTFAREVALGHTGAASYRKAYDTKAKPKSQGDQASRLKADPRIAAEIEAYRLALEAQKYRSSESLRALVIQSLVSVLIDPDAKQSTKVTAAKVLGTVTEVAAFTERKEITTISGSDAIKSQIMDQLKTLMLGSGSRDVTDIDAVDLLSELAGTDSIEPDAEPAPLRDPAADDPTHGAPPAGAEWDSPSHVHTIPHELSSENTEPTPLSSETPTHGGV